MVEIERSKEVEMMSIVIWDGTLQERIPLTWDKSSNAGDLLIIQSSTWNMITYYHFFFASRIIWLARYIRSRDPSFFHSCCAQAMFVYKEKRAVLFYKHSYTHHHTQRLSCETLTSQTLHTVRNLPNGECSFDFDSTATILLRSGILPHIHYLFLFWDDKILSVLLLIEFKKIPQLTKNTLVWAFVQIFLLLNRLGYMLWNLRLGRT